MGRIDGKVAIGTGGAGGIGTAITRRFVAEGARVADVLPAAAGPGTVATTMDVRSATEWAATVALALQEFGRLDVLVNNAGLFRPAPLQAATEDDLRSSFEVNQLGPFLGMQAVIAPMTAAGGGSIINFSSGAGMSGMAGLSTYSSTKFAVRGLTRCAAMELGGLGIRVNSIHPGGIDTPMVNRRPDAGAAYAALPIPRMGHPDEAAAMVLFLASDESSYCTGSEFVIDGGMGAGFSFSSTASS
ncbi:SDR family NAD(P)-dependent oxidoreductase [Pseudonocardia sp. GCM10023141]|uniref:SDR family NAD(P)-dependent oxidoreductase n=1 Tax=Pseudonocardia sp. GCM10023141 TaxID=3252653 RepID=UPI0036168A23